MVAVLAPREACACRLVSSMTTLVFGRKVFAVGHQNVLTGSCGVEAVITPESLICLARARGSLPWVRGRSGALKAEQLCAVAMASEKLQDSMEAPV